MFGVLVNVGSSTRNPNGRGKLFTDLTFEYLPIPEGDPTRMKVPTYRDLGFVNVREPNLPVHLDPEFETYTYGHVKRGFGDLENLLKIRRNGVLFFYATLQREQNWATYVIGYFRNPELYDCRELSRGEILKLATKSFANNAHLKREDPSVDLLIKGGEGSKLLKKAFPLAEDNNPLALERSLKGVILTATGKRIRDETPWFRWTLICNDSVLLLQEIMKSQNNF